MKPILSLLALGFACAPLSAQSIDVAQHNGSEQIAGMWQDDLAQSFIPTTSNCAGVGFLTWPGVGGLDDIEVKLYDKLPNRGGVILAKGNALGNAGVWVDVFWTPVPVTPGVTYYIVVAANNGSMILAGSINNPYADGMAFANSPYQAWPQFDYAFHTWTQNPTLQVSGACPNLTIDVAFGSSSGKIAFITSPTLGSYQIPNGSPCAGTWLYLAVPTLRMVRVLKPDGSLTLPVTVPAGACGQLYLQALDIDSCTVTNVAAL
jgi:hypothetical protein